MEPEFSENAQRILKARYLRKDVQGAVIETPDEMFRRVASHVARAEKSFGGREAVEAMAAEFHRMLSALEFL
ncbi:MAG TPA: ribonucleotide reductase N-terminal alpha domain-containing protein, partial [Desulfomonilia bacterium]|nr:ribonucleotide reductase N-terminal alpha domain-containing protein [Desulfomonilia bacterium]